MRTTAAVIAAAAASAALLSACSTPPPSPSATTASASTGATSGAPAPTPSAGGLDLYAGSLPAVAPRGTVTERTVRTPDGRTRSYRLFAPEGLTSAAPVLVALHGGLGSGAQFETTSGFDGLATSNGFLVAYPDGIGRLTGGGGGARTWNGGDCCGPAAQQAVDDVAFLRSVVADVRASHMVDPGRVFAAGHSNGGIMALRLACEAADVFVAVGVQSAALGVEPCTPRLPVSLLQIHGTADTNVPLDGGPGSGLAGVDFRPARQAATAIAAADGCTTEPTAEQDTANPDLVLTTWAGCSASSGVEFLAVTGAEHPWMGRPSPSAATTRLAGTPYADLDSSRAIWAFLAAHPRG